ncbi:hypothetical protein MYP_3296 [Sporocytophaga myxococcoides]|uniref:Cthe-2314-like HEPN domain-containing protein n=2 Tax=Sporocytophaga myxococcoides TaxID=153721 RepID=A0A098LI05_9BACT|nr:hypothetical protein MYP_3296 [Sporocytophaga myxococcoides]
MKSQHAYLENPFTIKLVELNESILKDFHLRNGFNFSANNFHLLNNTEKYISGVTKLQYNLFHVVEQIHFIKIFLKRINNKNYLQSNGINELTYIQYHTEVLSHKVHTILEVMKLLINEVYDLKITAKECSWNNLIGKLDKNSQPMRIIDNFFIAFESLIDLRHLNAHRGIYIDSEKDKIEIDFGLSIYEGMERLGMDLDMEFKKKFPMFLIKDKIKGHRQNRIKFIIRIEETIHSYIKEFLTSIHPQLIKKLTII